MRTGKRTAALVVAALTTMAVAIGPGSPAAATPVSPVCLLTGDVIGYHVIDGTDYNDYIVGTSGPDLINGYGGNDVIYGLGGQDIIYGGDGYDALFAAGSTAENPDNCGNELVGGPGADSLLGSSGADDLKGGDDWDQLFGHDGNDTLRGGPGADFLIGGLGDDDVDGGQDGDLCANDDSEMVLYSIIYSNVTYYGNAQFYAC